MEGCVDDDGVGGCFSRKGRKERRGSRRDLWVF